MSYELAWAAGFFERRASIIKPSAGHPYRIQLWTSKRDVEPILRFRKAVGCGDFQQAEKGGFMLAAWRAQTDTAVEQTLTLLWPFFTATFRSKILNAYRDQNAPLPEGLQVMVTDMIPVFLADDPDFPEDYEVPVQSELTLEPMEA